MDREGVDVALIFPATFSTASTVLDVEMQNELYAAYHRYLDAYCGEHPDRLKAAALMNARDPRVVGGRAAVARRPPWLAAVEVLLPEQMPIDDPALAPIFEAMDDADVPFVHHSFFYEPPYFPGYRDIWGNLAIARMASHPWGAQRLLAYVTLSGMFDRYSTLRIGFAECSGSWLGGWLNRMTYQADYLAVATAGDQAHADRVRPRRPDLLRRRARRGARCDRRSRGRRRRRRADVLVRLPARRMPLPERRSTSRSRGASSSARRRSPRSPARTPDAS